MLCNFIGSIQIPVEIHEKWSEVSRPFLRVPILKAIGAAERNGAGLRDYIITEEEDRGDYETLGKCLDCTNM